MQQLALDAKSRLLKRINYACDDRTCVSLSSIWLFSFYSEDFSKDYSILSI